jgi:AraC family transcriptional regulator
MDNMPGKEFGEMETMVEPNIAAIISTNRATRFTETSVNWISGSEESSCVPGHEISSSASIGHFGFSAEAAKLLDEVRRAMEQNPEAARATALRLVTALTLPAMPKSTGIAGGLAPWQGRKVDRYMRENIEGPLRLEKLAEQVSLSVSHFCRAFKDSFGTTPHMHIIQLRVELAQRLMLTTQEPLSQIALACGLANQSHLCKLFRRWVSETPNTWRRKNLSDSQAEAKHLCS